MFNIFALLKPVFQLYGIKELFLNEAFKTAKSQFKRILTTFFTLIPFIDLQVTEYLTKERVKFTNPFNLENHTYIAFFSEENHKTL